VARRRFEQYHLGMPDASLATASLARAVELLAAGAWQQAHVIVQKEQSTVAAWLHGIAHTLEGDLDNARYWYRKADRAFPGSDAVQQEIAAARLMVQGGTDPATRRGEVGTRTAC
jgi:hypothetical protein